MTSQGQDRIPSGYVRRAHGIGGDVVVRGMLTDAYERFVPGAVLLTDEESSREFEITAVREHQGDFIVTFAEVSNRLEAEALKGLQFTIDSSERRELAEGEWWPEDLVGCDVISADGESIGTISDVVTGASQDRLVVSSHDGGTGEVPFVAALVPEVDIDARRIVVDLPGGLLD